MIKNSIKISIIGIFITLFIVSCSNKRNTFISRNYQALATHYNVYFNGNESLKEGVAKIKKAHKENYVALLPVFIYEDESARKMAMSSMDRAIEKAIKGIKLHSITRKPKRKKKKSKSAKYKTFRRKNEYNKWIDDCYLLMGKARFYKGEYHVAEKTFDFIMNEYPQSDLIPQAKLWKAASLIDRGELIAGKELLDRIGKTKKLKKKDVLWITALRADIAIKEKNYAGGIQQLQSCIKQSKNKKQKARFYYLTAQLNQKIGNKAGAAKAFQDLLALKAGYEITFNANINRALSYTGGDGTLIRNELNKMLKDDKNIEYQDQIYYALAEMDAADDNMPAAIENYWKAAKVSVENDNQKAIAFLKLGDYYFGDTNFMKAKMCYDSSMTYLGSEYPNYLKITDRVKNLSELVTNLNTVTREDSLQRVAKMPVSERNKIIAELIKKVTDKELEEQQRIADAQSDRAFFSQNQMMGNNRRAFNSSNNQGNWYFYNPTNIGLGKSEFRRKWGRRKLADNWRRKNKSTFENENADLANENTDNGEIQKKSEKGNPKDKKYYLRNLPLTDAGLKQSNNKIMKALYQAALVYKNKLHQNDKALEQLQELLRRFPNNPYQLSTYYQCYAINKDMGNGAEANSYKQKIITQFADSEYAKALINPNYRNKLDAQDSKANSLYEMAFNKFKNFYYYEVIRICKEGVLQYPESNLKPRFLFLEAIAIGRTQPVENFQKALDNVLEATPPKEIANTVKVILKGLSKGEKPKTYTEQDMNIARQKQKLRNWRLDMVVPVEKQVEKIAKKIEQAPLYKAKATEPHLFVLLFKNRDANSNKVVFNISKYNADTYKSRTFKVEKKMLNSSKIMILVKGLNSKSDALKYFNRIITNTEAYSGLEEVNYRNFVITPDNLEILKETKDVEEYLNFYTKRYFNVTRKNNAEEDKKKIIPVKNKIKLSSFVKDDKSNHKFILLIPKKSNSKKIKNAIFNHDKDYTVKKESYDNTINMMVVNNIGTKQEALEYMQGLLADKLFSKILQGIEYRNFVISDNNFNTFYIQKQLQQYLKFFKKHYLIKQASSNRKNKVFGNSNGYKFNKHRPHYFALIYPIANVNSQALIEGIKDYNTRYLGIEVRKFDEKQDILLVTNMQDKKQAMMYFRAIISNRDLFAPVEKTGYRNFVISEENLEHLMQQKNIDAYIEFFKENYL